MNQNLGLHLIKKNINGKNKIKKRYTMIVSVGDPQMVRFYEKAKSVKSIRAIKVLFVIKINQMLFHNLSKKSQ